MCLLVILRGLWQSSVFTSSSLASLPGTAPAPPPSHALLPPPARNRDCSRLTRVALPDTRAACSIQ